MNTTYFLNLVAGNVFRSKTSPTIPTKYYLGLSKTTPTAAGAYTEPSGGGYARVEITSLSQPSNGVVTNGSPITFAESTASWGTVTHFLVFDAATGGNLLMYGQIAARTVEAETVMTVRAQSLSLTAANPA